MRPSDYPNTDEDWEAQSRRGETFRARSIPVTFEGQMRGVNVPAAVGGALVNGMHYARFRPSDFRIHTLDGLADEVLADDAWTDRLGVWGEYMIESTAAGLDPSIKSPAMAAAVRVNLHMHIQANFDDPADMVVSDEPFED